MEGIRSFEPRSTSRVGNLDFDKTNKLSRVIIVNRYDPSVRWSANNLPIKSNKLYTFYRLFEWFIKNLCCSSNGPSSYDNSFDLGPFVSNELLTSKYTIFNFLPKNLFEQFRRLANFYFLITAILQCILPFSPVGPTTSILPLFFVITTTAVKQAYEDYLRHKMDKEVNNRHCHVLRNKKLIKIRSKDIKVGDIVYVKNQEEIPCDMVLLATSGIHGDRCYVTTANLDGETNLKSRTCFHIKEQVGNIEKIDNQLMVIEYDEPNATLYEFNGFFRVPKDLKTYEQLVSNLDSTTTTTTIKDLNNKTSSIKDSLNSRVNAKRSSITSSIGSTAKIKSAIRTIVTRIKNTTRVSNLFGIKSVPANNNDNNSIATTSTIDSDFDENSLQPIEENKRSVKQETELILSNTSTSYHEIPLDITNLLLRASRLRNTTFIYGLAVYTGVDTKLAKNSQVKSNKFSSTESRVNTYLAIAFAILILLSIIGALRYKRYNYWYFEGLDRADSTGQIFIAHFLLYNYIIPISLYVTLEFIKFFGTISVVDDKKMKRAVLVSVNKTDSVIDQATTVDGTSVSKSTLNNVLIINDTNNNDNNNNNNSNNKDDDKEDNHQDIDDVNSNKTLKSTLGNSSSRKLVRIVEKPKCNSSDLNEELGLIEVLFSDKTGTLTENKMRFTACSAYGSLYRFIDDQLYLQPKELYHEPVYDITENCSKHKTNRHSYLANTNHVTKELQQLVEHSYYTKNKQEDFTIDEVNNNNLPPLAPQGHKTTTNTKSKYSPFNHRKIPPLQTLKLIDNLNENEQVVEFFICLCLCSTITLNETSDLIDCLPERAQGEYDFQTASPDEESLITAAHLCGITMCKSNDRECFIVIDRSNYYLHNNGGQENSSVNDNHLTQNKTKPFRALLETKNSNDKYIVRHFERLLTLEFNSIRKRMSVIYRDCDNNCLIMVSKGSEELLDCINFDNNYLTDFDRMCINLTMSHFEAFAKSGLRTLLVARKILSEDEFKVISNDMKQAKLSLFNRDLMMNNLYKTTETNLKLIGSTAVEDTLQEGVPETIENLKEAGIKVWLLTGDKVETAISVAYLCKLLDHDMKLLYMVHLQDSKACKRTLNSFKRILKKQKQQQQSTLNSDQKQQHIQEHTNLDKNSNYSTSQKFDDKIMTFGLIADGRSLYYAMKYHRKVFAKLCKECQVVLGCRLSPLQKAEIVEMIKQDKGKPITAAIGDGANDVSMIQEAHVGIGVQGKEGRQAVNCSDFAINRFYMLNRLFFVHGHLFYHRTATTIHYFFYKNTLFVLPQFLYSFYNLSSAQSLYHPILLICYNLFFTSLPILLYGLYEVHIPEKILENYPSLYKLNRHNYLLKMSTFFNWLFVATLEALISFFTLHFIWGSHTPFLESGKMADYNAFGLKLYFIIIFTVTMKLYFISNNHSFYFNLSALVSCLSLPILLFAYSLVDWLSIVEDNSLYGQVEIYLTSPMFWLAIFSTTLATIILDIVYFLKDKTNHCKTISSVLASSAAKSLSFKSSPSSFLSLSSLSKLSSTKSLEGGWARK